MASTQVVNAAALDNTCNTAKIFQYSIYQSPDNLFMKLTTMLTTLCQVIGSITLLNYPK